jgi:hypothetical protein
LNKTKQTRDIRRDPPRLVEPEASSVRQFLIHVNFIGLMR